MDMPFRPKRSWIEKIVAATGIIPGDTGESSDGVAPRELKLYPSPDEWSDFVEYDPKTWPRHPPQGKHKSESKKKFLALKLS